MKTLIATLTVIFMASFTSADTTTVLKCVADQEDAKVLDIVITIGPEELNFKANAPSRNNLVVFDDTYKNLGVQFTNSHLSYEKSDKKVIGTSAGNSFDNQTGFTSAHYTQLTVSRISASFVLIHKEMGHGNRITGSCSIDRSKTQLF